MSKKFDFDAFDRKMAEALEVPPILTPRTMFFAEAGSTPIIPPAETPDA